MKVKWEPLLTATLVICAVTTTALVAHREFAAPLTASAQAAKRPVFIRDWKSHLTQGVRLGPTSAPVQLIEFADFECPFCATFHKDIKALMERYPREVSLTFVHFPLPVHRFALPAARVAECAGEQGRFEAMHDQLFDGQDSFGLKPWSEYAMAAGVPDLTSFDACVSRTDMVSRIEDGKQLGARLNVKATPSVIVNGWMPGRPPTAEELTAMVNAILAGRSPMTGLNL